MRLRTLIIEDEEKDRKVIEKILSSYYNELVEIIGYANCVEQAVSIIPELKPDLLMLDIVLQGNRYGAFQILEQVRPDFQIIFITGQNTSEYYMRALKLNCIDYISKPTAIEDFKIPLEKALKLVEQQRDHQSKETYIQRLELMVDMMKNTQTEHPIHLPVEFGFIVSKPSDIVMCTSAGNYTEFLFSDQTKRMVSGNLKHYQELLAPFSIIRIHRQKMVNLKHVVEYTRKEGGKIILSNKEIVYLGESWKAEFERVFCEVLG